MIPDASVRSSPHCRRRLVGDTGGMKTIPTIFVAGVLAITASAQSQSNRDDTLSNLLHAGLSAFGGNQQQGQASLEQVTANWNETARNTARQMFNKYGAPQEVTTNRLVWHDNRPWKRTAVINQDVPHNFPTQHNDVLEQTLAIDVPVERYGDLAAFDGSISANRTAGEFTACCDREEHNFIALNLGRDVISGRLTVPQARQRLAELVQQSDSGERVSYAGDIRFSLPVSNRTGDADRPAGQGWSDRNYQSRNSNESWSGTNNRSRNSSWPANNNQDRESNNDQDWRQIGR
jgi:hypothetical protein